MEVYHINSLTKLKVYEVKDIIMPHNSKMFTYNNTQYILCIFAENILNDWMLPTPFVIYESISGLSDVYYKHTFINFKKNICNDIVITKQYKCKYKRKSYTILNEFSINKNCIKADNYNDLVDVAYKLERIYNLFETKPKYSFAIIRIPLLYDIQKLNIKQKYNTFMISYLEYSYIMIWNLPELKISPKKLERLKNKSYNIDNDIADEDPPYIPASCQPD